MTNWWDTHLQHTTAAWHSVANAVSNASQALGLPASLTDWQDKENEFMLDPGGTTVDAVGTFLHGLSSAVMALGPGNDENKALVQQAQAEWNHGNHLAAITTLTPLIGPNMAKAVKQAQSRDYSGSFGTTVGTALPFVTGAGEASPETAAGEIAKPEHSVPVNEVANRRAAVRGLMSPTEIEAAMKNRRLQDIQTPFDVTHGASDTINRDIANRPTTPQPVTLNASGESVASQEAINRAASQKAQGIKTYRVDSRSGNAVPILGVDAADATAKPYEHIVQVKPTGEVQIQDSGRGARPLDESKLVKQVAPQTVGTTAGATQDTALFQKAKAELGPDASLSAIAQRAQAMKIGTPMPVEARSVGAASATDLNTKPDVPPFYSKAEQVINDKVSNNASGESVKALLKNNGVKDDEMKWAGLDDFLKDKPKVSKADLQQFIKENQISLQDVDLGTKQRFTTVPNNEETAHAGGTPMVDVIDPKNGQVRFTGTEEAANDYMAELGQGLSTEEHRELNRLKNAQHDKAVELVANLRKAREEHGVMSVEAKAAEDAIDNPTVGRTNDFSRIAELEAKAKQGATETPTKYDKWTVPGEKENYQEKLLTLPTRVVDVPEVSRYNDFQKQMRAKYGDNWAQHLSGDEEDTRRELSDDLREGLTRAKKNGTYTAPHFSSADAPNIVAHVRFDDRPAVDGKKTLFMEEAQSDWHSAGRHEGYKADPKAIAAADDEVRKAQDARTAHVQSVVDRVNALREAATPEVRAEHGITEPLQLNADDVNHGYVSRNILDAMTHEERAKYEALTSDVQKANQATADLSKGGVPDAPFKQSWHELVMKRMLRQAAEKGYDQLAWTTGDQQAALYDLTKHIGKVEYNPDEGELYAYNPSGHKVIDENVEPTVKALTPYMGEALAEKLVDKIQDYVPSDEEERGRT